MHRNISRGKGKEKALAVKKRDKTRLKSSSTSARLATIMEEKPENSSPCSISLTQQSKDIIMPIAMIITGMMPRSANDPIKIAIVGSEPDHQIALIKNLIGKPNNMNETTLFDHDNNKFNIRHYSHHSIEEAAKAAGYFEENAILLMSDVKDFTTKYCNHSFNLLYQPQLYLLTFGDKKFNLCKYDNIGGTESLMTDTNYVVENSKAKLLSNKLLKFIKENISIKQKIDLLVKESNNTIRANQKKR